MSITPREFCERIYCGLTGLHAFAVAPSTQRIEFEVHVTDHGGTTTHQVAFDRVSRFTRGGVKRDESYDPGDRLELSVIEVERESDGWRVWFNPWYLEEIEFHCLSIRLDAAEVIGEGRWLQDALPR